METDAGVRADGHIGAGFATVAAMRRRHRSMKKDEALANLVCQAEMPEARRKAQ